MSKKTCIVSQSHICRNPGVLKKSIALSDIGYTVSTLTSIYSEELIKEDLSLLRGSHVRYIFYNDMRKQSPAILKAKVIYKIAVFLQSKFGIESRYSLGHNVNRLRRICVNLNVDLYIMQQELLTTIVSRLVSALTQICVKIKTSSKNLYTTALLPFNTLTNY